MLDKNKQTLKEGDLFKFTDGGQLIYETFNEGGELKFRGYSFTSRQNFDANKLTDFKFEIVGTSDEGISHGYYDVVKRERMKRGEHFLDS